MLKANKSKWFEKLFTLYNQNLLKRRFHSVKVFGLDKLSERDKDVPTIVYANHSSWWDGLIVFQISQEIKSDFYVMMEEKQLNNLQLFRKLGAFSVVRENPKSAVESINYAVSILKENKDRLLCIFPQGEILPNNQRPIKFFNGISRIVEKTGECQLACLAIRYEFLGEYKPEVFVKVDFLKKIKPEERRISKELTKELTKSMTKNLDSLNQLIVSQEFKKFRRIL